MIYRNRLIKVSIPVDAINGKRHPLARPARTSTWIRGSPVSSSIEGNDLNC